MNDEKCMKICRKNIERAVSWYLLASYAYYMEDNPIVSDETFDKLGKMLLKQFPKLKHKYNLTEDMLRAGTFLGQYPGWVPGVVEMIRNEDKTNE